MSYTNLNEDREYINVTLLFAILPHQHYNIKKTEGRKRMEDLYNLIYWGNYDQRIDALAKMTNENWNYKGMTNNLILKNYLKHTARKLQEEDKIIATDDYWIMNTGLFDSYYESIYIYAEKDLSDLMESKTGHLNLS